MADAELMTTLRISYLQGVRGAGWILILLEKE